MTTKRATRRKPSTTGITLAKSTDTRAKRKTAKAKSAAFAKVQATAAKKAAAPKAVVKKAAKAAPKK
jgi:hypothetical protein